jgi:predicted O-methyltransferase YrrM
VVQRHMVDRTLVALGRWYESTDDPVAALHAAERSRWSQNGEDGLIEALLTRVGAPTRTFVEIGAADGTENCTRALAEDGWRGVWFEGDEVRASRASELSRHLDVAVCCAVVTSRNVSGLLRGAGVAPQPDVAVLDIDGSDYWVLRSMLRTIRPRVLVVEYNATFPPGVFWTRRDRSRYSWDETYQYGASLDALTWTATRAGYGLVACDTQGVNAFFVREDVMRDAQLVQAPLEELYRPLLIKPPTIGHPPAVEENCPNLSAAEIGRVRLVSADVVRRGRAATGARYVAARVRVANGTRHHLTSAGPTPLLVSGRALDARGSVLHLDCDRNQIAGGVRPRSEGVAGALFTIGDPAVTTLRMCLVQEGNAWFEHSTIDVPVDAPQ